MGEMQNHWSYDILKQIAAEDPVSPMFLEELKSMYSGDIDSPRCMERINDINGLIDCLERRDLLSEENVEPLRYCGGKRMEERVAHYVAPCVSHPPINQYREQRLSEELYQYMKLNGVSKHSPNRQNLPHDNCRQVASPSASVPPSLHPSAFTDNKRSIVYKKLSEHLGSHWRKFGRELDISEGAMDDIEVKFPRELSARIYRLLQIFEEDGCHDPKQHFRIICEALENCRRKDLRRDINKIMSY